MKIQTKLVLVAALFSILVTSLGLFGLWKSRDTAHTSLMIDRLHALNSIQKDLSRTAYSVLTEGDAQAIAEHRIMINEYYDLYLFGFEQMREYPTLESHKIAQTLKPSIEELHKLSLAISSTRERSGNTGMSDELNSMKAELTNVVDDLDIDIESLTDEIRRKLVSISNETLLSKFFMISFLLVTSLLVLIVNVIFSRLVYRPIRQLHRAVTEMESGHLDVSVVIDREDELGQLGRAFNDMAKALHDNTEELRHAKIAAEAATEAKSRFVGCMSHELRTPLNAVIGYSELLADELEERDDADLLKDARRITVAGRALLSLISSVLDLEKIEVNKLELNIESVNLPLLLSEIEVTILPLASKNSNQFILVNSCHTDQVFSDGQKIRQILTNLIGNACKFTENGCVTLTVSQEQREDQQWIVYEVADSGIGMTEEQLDKVFEAFVQADSSTTRHYGGTGLGLTISREFAQVMGGDLSARSEYGQGSVFRLELPAACMIKSPDADAEPSPEPIGA